MKAILNIKKPEGLTPYQVVTKFKRKHPSYKDVKIAYAGRLDPMAKGVLLLLIEPETKKREEYQKLPKEYEFEILFGVSTDTHDLLGMPTAGSRKLTKDVLEKELKNITTNYKGTIVQKYPVYSSIRIKGKPLYWWARNNMLNKIQIPKKKIQIYNIKFESLKSKDKEKLLSSVIKKINKVEGDFRQKEIIKSWKKVLSRSSTNKFHIAKFYIHCSSGTYVRALTSTVGRDINRHTTTYSIKRISVGKYKLKDSITI